MNLVFILIGSTLLLGFGAFGILSLIEREGHAARVSISLGFLLASPVFLLIILPPQAQLISLVVLVVVVLGLILLSILPIGKVEIGNDTPSSRFDERDVVFSRYYLRPESTEYRAYYEMRPENEDNDERMRNRPGLYSPDAKIVDPTLLASPRASFDLADSLYPAVDGSVAEEKIVFPKDKMTTYIKNLAKFYGALEVGISELHPYHVYSHNGRGSGVYGEPIGLDHTYAIAITVEMDHAMTHSVLTASMETAKQYVEMARVVVQLAGAIRALGYHARAHFEGDYQVIVPLIARDAGLGEFGRMSILITPKVGPRVRIAAVTTNLELIPDQRRVEPSVLDFCTLCKKCAENCPSRAIPSGDRQEIDGALRWKINEQACYAYWNTSGVDCAICMAVCPYAHPDNLAHNVVRWGISKSGFLRRMALILDDVFYGKKPHIGTGSSWPHLSS
jgi:NAD-dependent dihydropyrimidine dehydrogenase PreA subunit